MSKSLKANIYRLLDEIEDETILNQLMEDVAFYATKKNIVETRSTAQQSELNKAIKEADNNETITWDKFKEEMTEWRKIIITKRFRNNTSRVYQYLFKEFSGKTLISFYIK